MGICLYLPFLFYSMTDLNTYNNSSITDAAYSRSFFEIRKSCANVFLHLLIYFSIFIKIKYRLKLSIPIFNILKMVSSGVFIKGGFEGLENQEVNAVPDPNPPEGSNTKSSTEIKINKKSAYPNWPIQTPAENIHTLPEINSEPVTTNEGNTKKVKIKGYVEVNKITEEGGVEKNNDVLIDAGPKKKIQSCTKKPYKYD